MVVRFMTSLRKLNVSYRIAIYILIFYHVQLVAEENRGSDSSFLHRIGKQFIRGILEANYREISLDEIVGLYRISLPKPVLPPEPNHPSLLFNNPAAPAIRMRQAQQPYKEWAEQIVDAALTIQKDPNSPLITELERSRIAKLNSFAFFLTYNPIFKDEARNALLHIRDPDPVHSIEGGKKNFGWGDWIQAAQAIQQYGVAYDLLYSEFNDKEIDFIEKKLISQTEQMIRYLALVPKNNHATAIASGIGTMALVLKHPMCQHWLDIAISQLQASLSQIEPDGSYREGVYYGRFIASCLYPFSFYLYNTTHINILQHVRIRRFNRWLIDMEKPDGSVPDFDDAFPEYLLYQPIAIGLAPESDEIRFFFLKNQSRFRRSDAAWIESYCAFKNQIQLKQIDLSSATFYPDGGMVVFRRQPDIYGLLLGEPGRPHLSGHDHVEPTSFTLHAFGDDFLIDGGYGPGGVDDPNRSWYGSAEAHNIPLIDGKGPNQNPIWGDSLGGKFEDYFETPLFSSVTVKTHYRDTQIMRKVCFIGQRYFIVFDRLESTDKKIFSIPWHGLGKFQFLDHQHVAWKNTHGTLEALFIQPNDKPLVIQPRIGLHTLDTEDQSHTSVLVRFPLSEQQKLLTMFLPQKPGQDILEVNLITSISNDHSYAYEIRSNQEGWKDIIIFSEGPWRCRGIESDAKVTIYHQSSWESDAWFSVYSGTFLRIAGELIFRSEVPIDMTVILDQQGWYGHLGCHKDSEKTRIHFYPSIDPGIILFNKSIIPYVWENDILTLEIRQSGIFQMTTLSDRIRTTDRIHENLSMINRLRSVENVQETLNVLSPAERMRLQNEIVSLMGEAGIGLSDRLTDCDPDVASLYRIISGIFNSSYNQTGQKTFTFPQVFEYQENLSGHNIKLYEEGFLNKKGLQMRKIQLAFDELFKFSQNNFFKGYQESTFEITQKENWLYTHIQTFQDQQSVQLGLNHQGQNQWFAFNYTTNQPEFAHTGNISYGRDHLTTHISWTQENGYNKPYSIRLQGKHRLKRWSSTWDCQMDEKQGLTLLRAGNLCHFSRDFAFQTSLAKVLETENHIWKSDVASQIWFTSGPLMGALLLEKQFNQRVRGQWQGVYFYRKWRFDSQGEYDHDTKGNVGIGYRSRKGSYFARLNLDKAASFQFTFNPHHQFTSLVRISGQTAPFRNQETTIGLFYHHRLLIGGEAQILSVEPESLLGITATIGVPIGKKETIQIDASSFYRENGQMKYYEIRMNQKGLKTTPGILLIGDERNLVRFEGYLQWDF